MVDDVAVRIARLRAEGHGAANGPANRSVGGASNLPLMGASHCKIYVQFESARVLHSTSSRPLEMITIGHACSAA